MRARPVLLAVVGTGWGRFLLFFFGLFAVPITLVFAAAATGMASWVATLLAVLYAGGTLGWTERVYFNPATRTLHRERGWPWLRLTFGRNLGRAEAFERVVCERKTDDEEKNEWVEIRLEGARQSLVLNYRASVQSGPARAAAMALVLGLPLEERMPESGRNLRPAPAEMRLRVKRMLEEEQGAGAVLYACAAMLFGNAVTLLGVLFAHWSAESLFALFWLDLCAIAFFTILRVAGAESGGWLLAPATRWLLAALLVPGAWLLLGLSGETLRFAFELPAPPEMRLLGFEVPPVFALAWRGIHEGGAWLALIALIAGHVVAYAVDLRREATIPFDRVGRVFGFAIVRMLLTVALAGFASVMLAGREGPAPLLVIAIVVAARGVFEAWAHVAAHAPLWLSGDLALMRAAREPAA